MIRSFTFESVRTTLSIRRIASSKVKMTFEVIGIPVEESGGTKVTLGAVASAVVKVAEAAIIAFPDASSRVAPMAR